MTTPALPSRLLSRQGLAAISCLAVLLGVVAVMPARAQQSAVPVLPAWLQKAFQARPPVVGIRQADSLGSGVLLKAPGCPLAVLTNKHVLPLQAPIELIVLGRRHTDLALARAAEVFAPELDAELLLLTAPASSSEPLQGYATAVAELAAMPPLFAGAGTTVRSFGYRAEDMEKVDFSKPAGPVAVPLSERTGSSAGVMSPALAEGYDLVMDVNVEQGMSGGPILNVAGQVVGINGVHARPAWGAPSRLRNGTQANPRLAELLDRSSLGLSMNQLLPALRAWQQRCMATTASDPAPAS